MLILTGQGFEYGYMSENACQSDMQTIGVSNKEEEWIPSSLFDLKLKLDILFQLYFSCWIMV